jgi:hypothetical protein
MKRKFLLILVSLLIFFGLFYSTNELLKETFEWYTPPILFIMWFVGIMGMMALFNITTDSDDSKGEEDRRNGRSDEWPKEAEQ